jgi:hypothetical protein
MQRALMCSNSSTPNSAEHTSIPSDGKIVCSNVLGISATTLAAGAHTNTALGAHVTGAITASAPSPTSPRPCCTRASGRWRTGCWRRFCSRSKLRGF